MERIEPDLWQSSIHRSGILNSHAYLLTRPGGNVLFYNTGDDDDLAEIEALGGIRYQLLTHRDEAAPSLKRIAERFGSRLGCSTLEAPAVGKHAAPDIVFEAGDTQLDDVGIFHTPGHTDGSLCFFYRSPHGKAYLFSGDTMFHWNGRWATLVLSKMGGSKDALAESLLRLRELEPDLVMSSGFVGDVAMAAVTRDEWRQAIDENVRRLARRSR